MMSMKNKGNSLVIPDEFILNQIYYIRGQKVMLDSDLAKLYNVETKRLKEAVKRNASRFPEDFMFELTENEHISLRSQIATSKKGRGGARYLPLVFTEHGVLMLSSVLNSQRAVDVNIQIMRIYTRIRKMLMDNTELRFEIENIKKKLHNHGQNIELVFKYLDEFLERKKKIKPRPRVGYKINGK